MTLATYRQEAMDNLRLAAHAESMAGLAYITENSREGFRVQAAAHRANASKILRIIARNTAAPFIQIEG